MNLEGKGKTQNAATFIKQHFDIVGNSILAMFLLGLEKLMDLEFKCPSNKPLAIVYSLVFLAIPTTIVGIIACYLSAEGMCCKTKSGNSEIKASFAISESNQSILEVSETSCSCCCEIIQSHFFAMKVVVLWMLIVFTDGRYGDCLVTSFLELIEKKANISYREPLLSWTEVKNSYSIQLFQIIGLILIFWAIFAFVFYKSKINSICSSLGCKFKSELEKYEKMNEDILLQITEDTLEEQARKKQKDFVLTLLSREDWASYNPGRPDSLIELGNITAKWKEEVKRQLKDDR